VASTEAISLDLKHADLVKPPCCTRNFSLRKLGYIRYAASENKFYTCLNILQYKEQSYCFGAAYKIYPKFLIGKLCVQHGDFVKSVCLRSKDVASGALNCFLKIKP
jgi:hypothetical protein